jgi:guanylate kinase
MSTRPPGKLVVVSGPSGAGKTSICQALLDRIPRARWSVSITTRTPRRGEKSGESYCFVSREEAERMIAAGELLEHAEYLGKIYGTPRAPVEEALARGEFVIMEIDVQGGAQVAAQQPDAVRIFVLPPSREALRARLEGRHTETAALQEKRLREADREIQFARESGDYQYFVTNDILQRSVDEVISIIADAVGVPAAVLEEQPRDHD